MTNYHPDVQRAYESHCADGYVVPDDEVLVRIESFTKDATESDETRVQAPGDGKAAERRTEGEGVTAAHHPIACMDHWDRCCCWCGRHNMSGPEARAHAEQEDEGVETKAARVLWETSRRDEGTISATGADIAARALADAGLLVSEDTRGALDETLEDLTRTLARAEKAEARAADLETAWREACEVAGKGADRKAEVEAERDRARDTAAALEAENASLTAKVERVRQARDGWDSGYLPIHWRGFAADIDRALSDTTGEATR